MDAQSSGMTLAARGNWFFTNPESIAYWQRWWPTVTLACRLVSCGVPLVRQSLDMLWLRGPGASAVVAVELSA